jgi:hypothetical protein
MKYMNNHYGSSKIFGKSKLNLQLFAGEDEENKDESEDVDQEEDNAGGESNEAGKTFNREELGAIVAQEVRKAQEKWEAEKKDLEDEAKRYEKMTAEQKKAYDDKQKDNKIKTLELELARNGISKTVAKNLSEEGIVASDEVVSFLTCDTSEETDGVVKAFIEIIESQRTAIREEFEKKFVGYIPVDGNATGNKQGAFGASLAKGAEAPKQTYFTN